MSNIVPEKLINFKVFNDGEDLLGLADVTLPDLEALTETIKGAGIAGEIDSPVLGHYKSTGLTLNWRTIVKDMMVLAQPKTHNLDIRGSQQAYDAGAGQYKTVPIRVVVRAMPKKTGMGKFDVGAKTDSSSEFELFYYKVWVNGVKEIEIDKYNYICYIHGEDFLSGVRTDLGI